MNDRTTLVIVLVALALACGTIFFERDVSTTAFETEDRFDVFRGLKTENVERIVLVSGDDSVILKRGESRWMFQRPLASDYEVQWEANPDAVNRLVDALVALEQADRAVVGSEAAELMKYGLESPRDRIEVIYGSERGSVTATLHLGKAIAQGGGERMFVRLNEENRIQVVENTVGQFLALVRDGGHDFRARNVFPRSDLERADEAVLMTPAYSARVERVSESQDVWQATWAASARDEPKNARARVEFVRELATAMQGLRVESFVADTASQEDLEQYGLLKPQAHVVLTLPQSSAGGIVAMLSGPQSADIRIGKPVEGDAGLVYAIAQRIPAIFTMKRAFLDTIPNDPGDTLPSKRLADFKSNEITKITLKTGGDTLRAHLVDFNWKITEPLEIDGDNPTFNALFEAVTGEECESMQWPDSPAPKELGLRTPSAVLTISVKSRTRADAYRNQRIEFGKTFEREVKPKDGEKAQKQTFIYARRAGDLAVRVFSLEKFASATGGPLTFYKRRICQFNVWDATNLAITRPDGSYTFEKRENDWVALTPFALKADQANVGGALSDLSWLNGEKIVSADPKDLARFGLDKPAYRVEVTVKPDEKAPESGEGEEKKPAAPIRHVILINKKADGDQVTWYGHAPGSPLIVTLAAALGEKLEGELATTDIFPSAFSLREAMIETDDAVTRLTRDAEGVKYEVGTSRDGKLEAADEIAARQLFDDLSTVRVQGRYVSHDAKDLSPYGFGDAAWGRLTVTDKDQSKTTLEVGSTADAAVHGKDRRYGRLAGTHAVFLLAQEALDKVFKPASEFAPKGEKKAK